jgi:ABC-2 type transport system ATP-binding protein
LPEPAISFSHVSKRYGAVPVLRSVDLAVPRGAAFALAGENGAGKTTLIKCMLDFCHYESGDIRINGITSRDANARAALAFLPERFTPPWFLTGRQFLESMRRLTGASWTPAEALQMLHDIGLDATALDRPAREYSKGMNQKLGLAACFLSGREIYVLDEPMTGLDPSARYRVKSILKRLHSQGRTLLITTHSLAEAEEICDHMAVLHGGALAFNGSPMELRGRYGEESLERAFLKCIGEGEGGDV